MKDGDWVDAMERKKRIGMKKKAEVTVEERIEILQNMIKGLEKKLDSKFESIPEVELTNKRLETLETRFEWWRTIRENDFKLYEHLKNSIYDAVSKVKELESYMKDKEGYVAQRRRKK